MAAPTPIGGVVHDQIGEAEHDLSERFGEA